jgi:hypothetical protein
LFFSANDAEPDGVEGKEFSVCSVCSALGLNLFRNWETVILATCTPGFPPDRMWNGRELSENSEEGKI